MWLHGRGGMTLQEFEQLGDGDRIQDSLGLHYLVYNDFLFRVDSAVSEIRPEKWTIISKANTKQTLTYGNGWWCSNCMFFELGSNEILAPICRRQPPSQYGWPTVKPKDWCGQGKW